MQRGFQKRGELLIVHSEVLSVHHNSNNCKLDVLHQPVRAQINWPWRVCDKEVVVSVALCFLEGRGGGAGVEREGLKHERKSRKKWAKERRMEPTSVWNKQTSLTMSLICQFSPWGGFQHWSYQRCSWYTERTWPIIICSNLNQTKQRQWIPKCLRDTYYNTPEVRCLTF